MNLAGKTIILTGARRIGQTVAEELAKKGANLAITYRTAQTESEAMCTACLALGVKAEPFQADLSKEADIKRLVNDIKAKFGSIDGLVHMAANYPKVPLSEVTMDNFTSTQQIIGGSTLLLAKYLIPAMLENTGDKTLGDPAGKIKGKIVLFSDWSALQKPYPEYLAYNMAKTGINSLTMALALQYAPDITVNAIAPGPILMPPDLTEEENKEALSGTPMARWGGAEEIAKAVLYLMDSDFVTGVILPVDGGRTIS